MSQERALAIGLAALYGAILGSFLNVCIYRLPRNESIVRPRSRCPGCGTMIAWYDNIPTVSWLVLRAKCRHCGKPISIQYPLVELAVALVWALAVWRYGASLDAVAAGAFVTLMIGILMTDAQQMIIPDEFSLGGLVFGLAIAGVLTWLLKTWWPLIMAGEGAALGYGLLWLAGYLGKLWAKREAMGGGDLKMMAMAGSFLGWRGVLMTIFLGSLVGTLVYLPALLRRERHREVPFGVFLAIGAVVTLVFGSQLLRWYLSLVSPA